MSFTIEDYKRMAYDFSKMSFIKKIETIKNNKNVLVLGSDHNWWRVKIADKSMREEVENAGIEFKIAQEWDSNEMHDLISLLGIDIEDYD